MDVPLLNTDGSILILCEAIDHTPWVFHSRPDDRPRPVSTLAAPVPAEDKDLILILKQEVRLGPCLKLVTVVQGSLSACSILFSRASCQAARAFICSGVRAASICSFVGAGSKGCGVQTRLITSVLPQ